jgi:hypothetical protein
MKKILSTTLRILPFVLIAIFSVPHEAHAIVTIDYVAPSTVGTSTANKASLTWSHTVSGPNTLLTVGVSVGKVTTNIQAYSLGVTFNGVAMTSANSGHLQSGTSNTGFVELFYLKNPSSGAHTVAVTLTGGTADMEAGSVSFNGVDQTTPISHVATNSGNGTSATLTVTSAVGDMAVNAEVSGGGSGGNTTSGNTMRWNNQQNTTSAGGYGAQSTAAGASSVNMSYTIDSDNWGIIGLDIVAASTNTIYLTTGSSWTVPADWNSSNNTIQCIGAGGGGAVGVANGVGGAAGGGGAYAIKSNLSLTGGGSVTYHIAPGGDNGATDTYFNGAASSTASLACSSGSNALVDAGGAGATTAHSIGDTKYAGGAGGGSSGAFEAGGGGGGGGSAGSNDAGKSGATAASDVGAGGGGSDGGSSTAGADGVLDATGGTGGNGNGGTGGGAGGDACVVLWYGLMGFLGGGGGGGSYNCGGASGGGGGGGVDGSTDSVHASGGGGGGGGHDSHGVAGNNGGTGGQFGGGGGGAGSGDAATFTAGVGGQGIIVITYTSAPTVTTQAASSITATTATGNGNITGTGNGNVTVRGFAWGTNAALSGGDTATTTDTTGQPFGTGAFTGSLSSLTCGTAYYARAYATNSVGDGLGTIVSFSTSACQASTVTTQAASSITATTATGNGTITSIGAANPDDEGFVYDTATHAIPGNVNAASSGYASFASTTGSFSTGAFTKALTGLSPRTTYYIRAFAHNSGGYSYGDEQSFADLSARIIRLFGVRLRGVRLR